MEKAVADAYANRGFLGKNIFGSDTEFQIITQTGAGAYEVGEESALMESLEGKRGVPRIKPPFPAVVGLYGGPTVINNAETIATVPHVIDHGRGGLRSGRHSAQRRHAPLLHQRPRRAPRRLRAAHGLQPQEDDLRSGGGIRGGRKLKGRCPRRLVHAGAAARRDRKPRHGLRPGGQGRLHARLGRRGGDRRPDLHRRVRAAHHQLLQHESCGWCIPCREGTDWLKKSLTRFHAGFGVAKDIDNIQYLAENMMGRTVFCPLGDARSLKRPCPQRIGRLFVKKFRKEFEDHLNGKPCPFAKCR
jgi:NADH-quinone oxidoreductase subunit F